MPPYRIRGAKIEELRTPPPGFWGSNELRRRERNAWVRLFAWGGFALFAAFVAGVYVGMAVAR